MNTRVEQFAIAHPKLVGGGLLITFLSLAVWTILENISVHRTLTEQKKGIFK